MDKAFLESRLAEGKSLKAIADEIDRHPSAVGYWLKRHGLQANGSERFSPGTGLSRRVLEPLARQGLSLREMAARLGCSISTVRYWLKQHDLDIERRRIREGDGDRKHARETGRTITKVCRHHGRTEFVVEGRGYARCRRCRADRVVAWRKRAKQRLVAEAGGGCRLCGYDRCLAALEFHHLDPAEKSFGLAMNGAARSMDKLRAEAAKCVLLCANCHAEVEAGLAGVK